MLIGKHKVPAIKGAIYDYKDAADRLLKMKIVDIIDKNEIEYTFLHWSGNRTHRSSSWVTDDITGSFFKYYRVLCK